jgi:hypothetical protein
MFSRNGIRNLAAVLALITVGSSAAAYMCHPAQGPAPQACKNGSIPMVDLTVERGNPGVYYLRAQVHATPSYPIGVTAFAFDASGAEEGSCALYPLKTYTSEKERLSTGTCAQPATVSVYGVEMCGTAPNYYYC